MSGEGKSPDLVVRAAARLQEAATRQLATDPTLRLRIDEEGKGKPFTIREEDRSATPIPDAGRAPGQASARHPHQIAVDPTSLAARSIFLPSATNARTVEEFRVIKRQVLTNVETATGQPNRVIMVTSARPGEGKTYTSINLALSIAAERDTSVLLVDADVYRQSLMKHMGVKSEAGWVDYVAGAQISLADILHQTDVPNLRVLPAGKVHAEVPELLSSHMMSQFVTELIRRHTDGFIIFDCLPCLLSSEPAILARIVGQVVFVVAAHETSREQVESSLRLIGACPRVSLLLNKSDPALTKRYGTYGYAYKRQA